MLRAARKLVLPNWTDAWPDIVSRASSCRTLHLGSGLTPLQGAVTVDLNPELQPDVICDLNDFPWPFNDNSFDMVVALSIIEHLDDVFGVMGEVHRVCRVGAEVNILVPHFSSDAAFVDPTHKQNLSARSCDYFIPGTDLEKEYGFYVPYRFELIRRYVDLVAGMRYLPGAAWLARRHSRFWEAYLCFILRGKGVFWQLKVLK